jgi:hypothetical protein
MNSRRVTTILATLFVATAALAQDAPRPTTLSVNSSVRPFWISADSARTPAGEVNYELFAPGLKEFVKSQAIMQEARAAAVSGGPSQTPCGTFMIVNTEGAAKAMSTWRSAVNNADAILVGTGRPRNGEPFLPQVNDHVIIFAFDPPNGLYLEARDENLIFGRRGQVYMPFAFSRDPSAPGSQSFEEVVNQAGRQERLEETPRNRGARP